MPILAPEEETELRNYLAAEGSSDAEAKALLARHLATSSTPQTAAMPKAHQFRSPAPAGAERPSASRAQARSPAEPDYPLMSTGGSVGGAIGSALGTPGGIPGKALGGAIGGFLGDTLGAQYEATKKPYTGFLDAFAPRPGESLKQGAVQGGMAGGLGVLGRGAAKLGFPKVAAFLGGTSPRQAVADAAPQAASGISQDALMAVDAAGQVSPQGAVQAASQGAQQAAAQAPIAQAGALAKQQIPGLQAQMAQNIGPLADKTAGFADALQSAAPKPFSGPLQGDALRDAMNSGGASLGGATPQDLLQAFRRPTSFPWAAGNPDVMAARAGMTSLGAQQGQLGDALGAAKNAVTAAQGLPPAAQLAGNAQGLDALAKLGIPRPDVRAGKLASLVMGPPKPTPGVAPVNFRGGARASQTAAALLGDSASTPLSASAPPSAMTLSDLLAALLQNRSNQ